MARDLSKEEDEYDPLGAAVEYLISAYGHLSKADLARVVMELFASLDGDDHKLVMKTIATAV